MNLIDKLIATDKNRIERQEKEIVSKRLSRLLGEEAKIKIRELSGRRINDLNQMMVKKNGERDSSKIYDTNLMYCLEGIVEPDLKDSKLMSHFGAATPKDLVEILFDSESSLIAGEIISLSGLSKEDEEEVKN